MTSKKLNPSKAPPSSWKGESGCKLWLIESINAHLTDLLLARNSYMLSCLDYLQPRWRCQNAIFYFTKEGRRTKTQRVTPFAKSHSILADPKYRMDVMEVMEQHRKSHLMEEAPDPIFIDLFWYENKSGCIHIFHIKHVPFTTNGNSNDNTLVCSV